MAEALWRDNTRLTTRNATDYTQHRSHCAVAEELLHILRVQPHLQFLAAPLVGLLLLL